MSPPRLGKVHYPDMVLKLTFKANMFNQCDVHSRECNNILTPKTQTNSLWNYTGKFDHTKIACNDNVTSCLCKYTPSWWFSNDSEPHEHVNIFQARFFFSECKKVQHRYRKKKLVMIFHRPAPLKRKLTFRWKYKSMIELLTPCPLCNKFSFSSDIQLS